MQAGYEELSKSCNFSSKDPTKLSKEELVEVFDKQIPAHQLNIIKGLAKYHVLTMGNEKEIFRNSSLPVKGLLDHFGNFSIS